MPFATKLVAQIVTVALSAVPTELAVSEFEMMVEDIPAP
jgi:hypothetical protein